MSDSIVIIPTYNEKENIEAIIRQYSICLKHLISLLSMMVLPMEQLLL